MTAEHHSVQACCRVLRISESGFYAWRGRAPSNRAIRQACLTDVITQIHLESNGTYGVPRVHTELRLGRGVIVGHNAVELLMRRAGLKGLGVAPMLARYHHPMASGMTSGIGWLRVAVGVALGAAPGPLLRGSTGEGPSGSMLLLARTVGIRDLVIGAGTISASRSGKRGDIRRWIAVGLVSDVLDAVTGIAGVRLVGRRRALIATGVTLPVIAAGLWSLSHLELSTGQSMGSDR